MRLICASHLAIPLAIVSIAALIVRASEPIVRYDDHKVFSIEFESPLDVAFIENIGGDIWSHRPVDGAMDVRIPPDALEALRDSGLQYRLKIENLQELVEVERDGMREAAARGIPFLETFHRYDDIIAYLEQLAAQHPDLASVFDVGRTVEGRMIRGIRIAGADVTEFSPAVIYFSTVHAREWITTTINPYVATHLLENYGVDPQVTDLVDRVEWLLIPVANPDGYEYSRSVNRFWRKNRRDNGDGTFGIDINRNWGWAWGGIGSSGAPGSDIYRGPHPFSEPETMALRDLFLLHPNTRAQLDIHSFGQLILWPWGFTPVVSPDESTYQAMNLAMQQLIFGVHNRFFNGGPIYTGIYPVSGDSLDWSYGERGIWSISFELRGGGFVVPISEITPSNEELLPAILYLSGSEQVQATQINHIPKPPTLMTMGVPQEISVSITSGVEVIDPSMAQLHYRYDPTGPYKSVAMQHVGNSQFVGHLPPTNCSSTPQYYVSLTTASGTLHEPPTAPFLANSMTMQHWSADVPDWIGPVLECVATFGDHNGDTEVNLIDYSKFSECMDGPSGQLLPECGVFDVEPDGDVDLADMLAFQNAAGES